jgi:hypothetical protein
LIDLVAYYVVQRRNTEGATRGMVCHRVMPT